MKIETNERVSIEVYKGNSCIAQAYGKDFDVSDLPCSDIDYYKITPIERFQVVGIQCNSELAHIKDRKNDKNIANWIDKQQAYKLTETLNNLNNQ